MGLDLFLAMGGEDFEIRRNGALIKVVRGLMHTKENQIEFHHGTDIQEGDELYSKLSKKVYTIMDTDIQRTFMGERPSVLAIFKKAATPTPTYHISGTFHNSNIVQGSPCATQNVHLPAEMKNELATLIEKILGSLGSFGGDAEEVEMDCNILNTMLQSAKPKTGAIRGVVEGLAGVLMRHGGQDTASWATGLWNWLRDSQQ